MANLASSWFSVRHIAVPIGLSLIVANVVALAVEELTVRFSGRDMRLTDVHGRVVEELLA
jgi:hypothetical protein